MQLDWVHNHGDYDAVVDTFVETVDSNLEKLKQLLYSGQKPMALTRYREKIQAEQAGLFKIANG